jgi:hypothetical protein
MVAKEIEQKQLYDALVFVVARDSELHASYKRLRFYQRALSLQIQVSV